MSRELPKSLLHSLEDIPGFDRDAFIAVHLSGEKITSVRLNPSKISLGKCQLPIADPIPWTTNGYYLAERPSFTFDPLFHAGCYYVQEASSMFLEQAVKQTADLSRPLKVLDLCASPGGKSTHIQSLISKDSLLVSNEVIRSRASTLRENIIKWGGANVVVTNNDPKDFAELENYFDIIVVDAPCSGSGLFRRDSEAIDEWSENNVELCSQRQQRILADVWPALKKEGLLIYSTCSYSKGEDEEIVHWIENDRSAAAIPLQIQDDWKIVKSGHGYRFWPDKVKGEGFFITAIKKVDGDDDTLFKTRSRPTFANRQELETIGKWVDMNDHIFIKHLNTVYAWPEKMKDDFSLLLEKLRVIYSGILVGELVRDKLVPDHALAMSAILSTGVNKTGLNKEQAIAYLQRKEFQADIPEKGWQLVTYKDHPLGWINNLQNRINNYYPKELRILKDV